MFGTVRVGVDPCKFDQDLGNCLLFQTVHGSISVLFRDYETHCGKEVIAHLLAPSRNESFDDVTFRFVR